MPSARRKRSAPHPLGLPIPRRKRQVGRSLGISPHRTESAGSIGCGIDVVELPRFKRALSRGRAAFLRRVFTAREQAYARARQKTALLHLAGRFAAKEAVIKAVSQIHPGQALAMRQVEIRNDRLGRPHIVLHQARLRRVKVHISLSHVKSVAVASAIAVRS